MKNHKQKPAGRPKTTAPKQPTPDDLGRAALDVARLLVYVLVAALIGSVYICQKMQIGAFYWPAE